MAIPVYVLVLYGWHFAVFFEAAGQHQVKGGAQLDRISLDELYGMTGNLIQVFWDQGFGGDRGPFGYYRVTSNDVFPNLGLIVQGEATMNNLGFFVQDAWTIGRLTLHLGLRTENEHVPSLLRDPRAPSTASACWRSTTISKPSTLSTGAARRKAQ